MQNPIDPNLITALQVLALLLAVGAAGVMGMVVRELRPLYQQAKDDVRKFVASYILFALVMMLEQAYWLVALPAALIQPVPTEATPGFLVILCVWLSQRLAQIALTWWAWQMWKNSLRALRAVQLRAVPPEDAPEDAPEAAPEVLSEPKDP